MATKDRFTQKACPGLSPLAQPVEHQPYGLMRHRHIWKPPERRAPATGPAPSIPILDFYLRHKLSDASSHLPIARWTAMILLWVKAICISCPCSGMTPRHLHTARHPRRAFAHAHLGAVSARFHGRKAPACAVPR